MFNCIVIPGRAATLVVLLQMKKFLSLMNSVAKSMCLIVETKEEFGLENG